MGLEEIAKEIRKDIMKTAYKGGSGHIASALSAVEIMTALYFGGILKYDPQNPGWKERDKLILSKGHASLVLYSVLKRIGYISQEQLDTFCQPGSYLGGEPKLGDIPGVEATTGSLGHGLSFAVGIAMANKMDQRDSKVYVILGDGECQEGSVWEAALSAAHNKLDNLTVILDCNALQAMDTTESIVSLSPLAEKWKGFGWHVMEMNGNDMDQVCKVLKAERQEIYAGPRIVIAHTIKGKGISFMENVPIWHYRMPNQEEMEIVKRDLNLAEGELKQ